MKPFRLKNTFIKIWLRIRPNGFSLFRSGLIVSISVLAAVGIVRAGTIALPSGGSEPAAKFYTLTEIYNLITSNATTTEAGHAFTFTDSYAGSGRTLTEIYGALTSLVDSTKVLTGTTYLGTAGTMANNGAFSLSASSTNQTVAAGYYTGGTLSGDADLAAANIRSGVTLFGVSGSLVAGAYYGGNSAATVLTTASAPGTYNASNLSATTVKSGVAYGISSTGGYIGYVGTGWSSTGPSNAATCEANTGWYWFEDGNGDGDTTDPEDGLCVLGAAVSAASWNGAEQVDEDNDKNDVSWIGDWGCTDPDSSPLTLNGTVDWNSYPTYDQASTTAIALAATDCYDGVRDLLPTVDESVNDDRIVYSGTAETGSDTTLTDTDAAWETNAWVGQKVKIFSGTSAGSEATVVTSSATGIQVASWSAGAPDSTSQFGIIYILPWSCYRPNSSNGYATSVNYCNGPLTQGALEEWRGSRLPWAPEYMGFCGSDGSGSSGEYRTSCSSDKTYGYYSTQLGRTDECIAPSSLLAGAREWTASQGYQGYMALSMRWACGSFADVAISTNANFRAIFRP